MSEPDYLLCGITVAAPLRQQRRSLRTNPVLSYARVLLDKQSKLHKFHPMAAEHRQIRYAVDDKPSSERVFVPQKKGPIALLPRGAGQAVLRPDSSEVREAPIPALGKSMFTPIDHSAEMQAALLDLESPLKRVIVSQLPEPPTWLLQYMRANLRRLPSSVTEKAIIAWVRTMKDRFMMSTTIPRHKVEIEKQRKRTNADRFRLDLPPIRPADLEHANKQKELRMYASEYTDEELEALGWDDLSSRTKKPTDPSIGEALKGGAGTPSIIWMKILKPVYSTSDEAEFVRADVIEALWTLLDQLARSFIGPPRKAKDATLQQVGNSDSSESSGGSNAAGMRPIGNAPGNQRFFSPQQPHIDSPAKAGRLLLEANSPEVPKAQAAGLHAGERQMDRSDARAIAARVKKFEPVHKIHDAELQRHPEAAAKDIAAPQKKPGDTHARVFTPQNNKNRQLEAAHRGPADVARQGAIHGEDEQQYLVGERRHRPLLEDHFDDSVESNIASEHLLRSGEYATGNDYTSPDDTQDLQSFSDEARSLREDRLLRKQRPFAVHDAPAVGKARAHHPNAKKVAAVAQQLDGSQPEHLTKQSDGKAKPRVFMPKPAAVANRLTEPRLAKALPLARPARNRPAAEDASSESPRAEPPSSNDDYDVAEPRNKEPSNMDIMRIMLQQQSQQLAYLKRLLDSNDGRQAKAYKGTASSSSLDDGRAVSGGQAPSITDEQEEEQNPFEQHVLRAKSAKIKQLASEVQPELHMLDKEDISAVAAQQLRNVMRAPAAEHANRPLMAGMAKARPRARTSAFDV